MENNNIEGFKKLLILFLSIYLTFFIMDFIRFLFAFYENDINYLNIISFTHKEVNMYAIGYMVLRTISNILLLLGVVQFIKIIKEYSRSSFFESFYVMRFQKTGRLFIYSSIVGGFTILIEFLLSDVLMLNSDRMYYKYFIFIVGCFLILIHRILKEGEALKKENDLTI